jgi:phage baseplate assembly protein W
MAVPIYSDLAFNPKLNSAGDLTTVTDLDSVKQSIYTIIKTPRGSRVMMPIFGVGIERFLFEPINEEVASSIATEIQKQLELFETRITINKIQIKIINDSVPGYEISIKYFVNDKKLNDQVDITIQKN